MGKPSLASAQILPEAEEWVSEPPHVDLGCSLPSQHLQLLEAMKLYSYWLAQEV